MRRFVVGFVTSFAILSAAMAGTANALAVTETTDFLGATVGAPNVGNVSLGMNTVSGSLNSFCSVQGDINCNNSPDGQDSFVFDIPLGLAVDSIGIDIFNVIGPQGFFANLSGSSVPGSSFGISFALDGIFSSGNVLGTILPVFGIDSYVLSVFGRGADEIGDWSLDYTVSINAFDPSVAPIPLPAALPLFGTSLGILGFLGWRRRRKAV